MSEDKLLITDECTCSHILREHDMPFPQLCEITGCSCGGFSKKRVPVTPPGPRPAQGMELSEIVERVKAIQKRRMTRLVVFAIVMLIISVVLLWTVNWKIAVGAFLLCWGNNIITNLEKHYGT